MKPAILGFDPSLSHFGAVILGLEPLEVLRVSVFVTTPTAKKKRPRECDDQSRRARELAEELKNFIETANTDFHIIAASIEAGALPRIGGKALFTPTTASALGRARGLLDALLVDIPSMDFTPMEVRKEILGESSAPRSKSVVMTKEQEKILKKQKQKAREAKKEATRLAMEKMFPEVVIQWPKVAANVEHAADALSVAVLCARSEFVRQVLNGIRDHKQDSAGHLRDSFS